MEYIYGVLLLHKLGQAVNENNLKKIIDATGKHADDSKVKTLIASLQGIDIESELQNASVAAAAPAAGAHGAGSKKEEAAEKKKEEKQEESAAGLASLFG